MKHRIVSGIGIASCMLVPSRAEVARPCSHERSVVVESVDLHTRTFHVRIGGAHRKPLMLYGREEARFTSDGESLGPAALQPGQRADILAQRPFFGPWPLCRLTISPCNTFAS